jgi:hypothetical protein
VQDYADRLPDDSAILYRCFNRHNELLFIATSFEFVLKLAALCRVPWHRQIDHTHLTHYDSLGDALAAESEAIRREQPYNTAPSRRHDVTVSRHVPGSARVAKRQPAPVIPPPAPGVTRIKRPTGRLLF